MQNSIESDIMRCVVGGLSPICKNVFFGKSQVIYPKINGDLRKMGAESYYIPFRLVLDYYAADGDPQTVVAMHEQIRAALFGGQAWTDTGALITFRETSGGGFVEEKDNEKIVHYMDAYEINYYKNTEI